MMRYVASFVLVLLLGVTVSAEEPGYIGAGKCKFCHKVQHASWGESSHAKAFERLKPEEQSDAECLKCHATANSVDLPGVLCEACHGPGSDYKSKKVMESPEAALAAIAFLPRATELRDRKSGRILASRPLGAVAREN